MKLDQLNRMQRIAFARRLYIRRARLPREAIERIVINNRKEA